MLQGVRGPVNARPLAVPKAEDPLTDPVRVGLHLLGADHLGGAEFFVHGREKRNARLLDKLSVSPDLQIHTAKGRAAIARDIPPGIQPPRPVTAGLV